MSFIKGKRKVINDWARGIAFCEVLDSEVSHSKSKRAKKSDFKFCYFLFYGFICLMPVGEKEGFCNTVDIGEKKKEEYCDSSDNVFYDRI